MLLEYPIYSSYSINQNCNLINLCGRTTLKRV